MRAVIILAIGISLVLSTDMLMSGFLLQIQQFASLIDNSGSYAHFYPGNKTAGFNQLDPMIQRIESAGFSEYLPMSSKVVDITYEGNTFSIQITQTNLSILKQWQWIKFDDNLSKSDGIYLNRDIDLINQSSLYTNQWLKTQHMTYFSVLDYLSTDVLVSNSVNVSSLELRVNDIAIRLNQRSNVKALEKIADDFGVQLRTQRASNRFLELTAGQITQILILLQFAMSFLLILSISYVMVSLVLDSADDLRILHMIGLERSKIFLLFLGQSVLASILATIFATIFSVLLLYIILPLLTLGNLPYGIIVINPEFIGLTAIQALIVGILSGLYPAKLGVDLYG